MAHEPKNHLITILLAEDHSIVREGIRKLLELEDDFLVIGEAENGREAVERTRKLHPLVVLMDVAMPLLNGLEATRQITHECPRTRVFVLSAHGDDAYVKNLTAAGASGYLVKQASSDILAEGVREVAKGHHFFGSSVSPRLQLRKGDQPDIPREHLAGLSPRETEVLQLVAEGRANKQVAADLRISIKTVEKHRQSMMDKLHIHDTAGLTRYAIGAGIIESSVQKTTI